MNLLNIVRVANRVVPYGSLNHSDPVGSCALGAVMKV